MISILAVLQVATPNGLWWLVCLFHYRQLDTNHFLFFDRGHIRHTARCVKTSVH